MTAVATNALARHTAVPALAGFVYQIQHAILDLFALEEGESLGIEVLDDIDIQSDGAPVSLSQVKLHQGSQPANLSDGSEDLWNTLGIWSLAIADRSLDLSTVRRLILLTTANAPEGSIAAAIASVSPVDDVVTRLLAVPFSASDSLRGYQQALHNLDSNQLRGLVARLEIHPNEPGLGTRQNRMWRELRRANFHETSFEDAEQRLSGWVWMQIIEQLGGGTGVLISEARFRDALLLIRDDLNSSNLPVRFAGLSAEDVGSPILQDQLERMYIRQLEVIGATENVKQRSIINYLRAFRERSEWIERADVMPDRLGQYDRELVERWQPDFDDMCLHTQATDDAERVRAGYDHFRNIEHLDVPIHPTCGYRYVTTGSYHMLADNLRVGWHPRFRELCPSAENVT